jgi:proteasome lid subunit RPN8/RPN11
MDGSQGGVDFPKFMETADRKHNKTGERGRPEDVPFDTAYNDPPEQSIWSILNRKLELNKQHFPTKRGWRTLNTILSKYRSKKYETFRYILLNTSGEIVDHVAITNRLPDRVKVHPDFMTKDEYFLQLAEYTSKNDYKIIMVHNHPSGDVDPSGQDIHTTEQLAHTFKNNFAGHLILDHGSFGLFVPGKKWEIVYRKTIEKDPLVKQGPDTVLNYTINNSLTLDTVNILRCALKIDDGDQWNGRDWVAVAFTTGWGYIKALHYYHTSEFFRDDAACHILEKTVDIASRSGAIWAFAFTENNTMLNPMRNITKETGVFRDFYVNGIIGKDLGLGGSVHRHFSHPTEIASTIPIRNSHIRKPAHRDRKSHPLVAAVTAANDSGAGDYLLEEEKRMQKGMIQEENGLSQKKHQALVEFLSVCRNKEAVSNLDAFYEDITGLREFQFLKDYVPRLEDGNWTDYHQLLNERYITELVRYHKRFPDLPSPSGLPRRQSLLEDSRRVQYSPADFLEAAMKVSTAEEYREVYKKFPSFDKGAVKAVSPRKIALFHEGAALPLLLEDNTPENWAKLYTKANDNGITINGLIPGPADVESLGTGILKTAAEYWKSVRSEQWQLEQYRRTCTQDRHSSDEALLLKIFQDHPYTAGTAVPPFILQDESGVTTYAGFSFKSADDTNQSLTLARKSPEGKEETVTISAQLYKTMIDNAGKTRKKPETTPEVLRVYDRVIAKDAEDTRSNTAANFWHNYRILCRRQASNPQEAMEVAKAIVGQMPKKEQEKFRRNIKTYEKATRQLVANPLLRPFVKPQETYNQRILNYYEENVKDLPIKDKTVHDGKALAVIRHGTERIDTPGRKIDPALRLKIGDTVKLSLDCKTLFGETRKHLPVTGFIVVSASDDLNKIVLLDKTGNSKYTLAKDAFTEKMRKLERKLEKRRHKQDKYESIRY